MCQPKDTAVSKAGKAPGFMGQMDAQTVRCTVIGRSGRSQSQEDDGREVGTVWGLWASAVMFT